MEVVGAVSAVLTIAGEFDHICKRLRRCSRYLKYAKDDVTDIRDEVDSFRILLTEFHRTLTDERWGDEGLSREIKTTNIVSQIVKSGRRALASINSILAGLDPLRRDKEYPAIQQWYARWKWSTRKEEWLPAHTLLNSIKGSANLLISIVICHHFLRSREQLDAENRTIPDDLNKQISLYASQTQTMVSNCRKTERTLRRMQAQQADMLRLAKEFVALSFDLAQSHIESNPELEAVLTRHRIPSVISSNSTASKSSGSSRRVDNIRPSNSSNPRESRSGESSADVLVSDGSQDDTAGNPVAGVPAEPLHRHGRSYSPSLAPLMYHHQLRLQLVIALRALFQPPYGVHRYRTHVQHPIPRDQMQTLKSGR
ncbi:hypothetical protein AYO21_08910 [Fonsecaea monophora]|uniref:Fungal N-terminal domain-containing protein n=1 Tax=Fonsecaea monophora TaxID=254056 RepID=A0A177EXQ9_9EURO|nr:hypothetical protein AYO21_08910 [Fonsecaea monophora]OAG36837.1 hypothetical protein AYO21_08910 [Fonsecaea monophora]